MTELPATTKADVWDAWNALPDDCPAPVRMIARDLGLDIAYVASVVYPADTFGLWDSRQEPDL